MLKQQDYHLRDCSGSRILKIWRSGGCEPKGRAQRRILSVAIGIIFAVASAGSSASPADPNNRSQTDATNNNNQSRADAREDKRETFEAHAFLGYVVDSFAAKATKAYLNPGASGDLHERWGAGFDFSYRLVDAPNSTSQQLWLTGRTLHGVRSTDVDCAKSPDIPVCKEFGSDFQQQYLYILRNARTLEGFIALRYEFLGLHGLSNHPARAYVKVQGGFLTVASTGDDLVDVHHLGVGVVAVGGPFRDSFVELGRGRNDVFAVNATKRWKVGGYLTWGKDGPWASRGIRPFAAISIDSDFGPGADSIQSYFGLAANLDKFCLINCGVNDQISQDSKRSNQTKQKGR